MYAEHVIKVATTNLITMSGWFNCGVSSNGSFFDISTSASLTNTYGQYLQIQVLGAGQFQIHLENQSVTYSPWITLNQNTWYWMSWNCNFTTGNLYLTVYNADGSFNANTTIGCNTDTGVKFWSVGNAEARTATTGNLYFENWYADYTVGNYPLTA